MPNGNLALYERCGVREYWIVGPFSYSVTVYALKDDKYVLINVYSFVSEKEIAEMDDEEKAEVIHAFSPLIFPDLKIPLAEVFEDVDY